MTLRSHNTPPSEEEEGIKQGVSKLAKDAGDYLKIRGELFAIEAQEASKIFKKQGTAFGIAAFFGIVAYLLIMTSLVGITTYFLSQKGEGLFFGWIGSSLIIGGIHLLLSVMFIMRGRQKPQKPLFEYTRQEWSNDQEWIKSKNNEN